MNTKLALGVVIILLVIGGFLFVSRPVPERAPLPKGVEEQPSALGDEIMKEYVIEMTARGFSPVNLNVPPGTTVKFINRDSATHWPASDIHPTHQICPGFDSLSPVQAGASHSFKFETAKTCPMHDHLNPALKGSIIVQ